MFGLMQEQPLLISSLIEHAAEAHADRQVVSRDAEGRIRAFGYRELAARARALARALIELGVRPGDRVATLAWNDHRHMELYYAVSGIGAVIHTVNPRLFPQQIGFILNHAESVCLFFDPGFGAMVAELAPGLSGLRHVVEMADDATVPPLGDHVVRHSYERLLAGHAGEFAWPQLDDRAASGLCYTSGTTGDPKGVLYAHRSTVLHALSAGGPGGFDVTRDDVVLAVVPLFHVNAWGLPYVCALSGATLVLPGPRLDGASIYELMRSQLCTVAFGVPTVWMGLLDHVSNNPQLRPRDELRLQRIVIGGAAAPAALIDGLQDLLGCDVILAWGMTELSPLGSIGRVPRKGELADEDERRRRLAKQGRAVFGVTMKIVDADGRPLPRDGRAAGRLLVRGPWVTSGYFRHDEPLLDADGFFETGDIATIDPSGDLEITDRMKDVIKSGGEWISSIELEGVAASHPAVAEAAVIAMAHPKWQERPLLIVRLRAGMAASASDILGHMAPRVARWWLPDDIAFVDDIPHTATGKIQKTKLRERFARHQALQPEPS
ncbi:long-chain-fatty-acid--CoA ligase [Phreatobacter stygius]|uniref:3-methylmercaptopropionyl-CoA ligase n=1 Tax=Phreatobacter stygius TaxID=1940610 RepID=A0A4D7BCJ8_9HYPH|nr:long-chain-fatty-acid--CoA ligase [Phreatobacter stygius]QCI68343.1 long-chain-fatty-acid--CoA ligase [Phreatobacter stygius]